MLQRATKVTYAVPLYQYRIAIVINYFLRARNKSGRFAIVARGHGYEGESLAERGVNEQTEENYRELQGTLQGGGLVNYLIREKK